MSEKSSLIKDQKMNTEKKLEEIIENLTVKIGQNFVQSQTGRAHGE
jgi:hypothetical protein